MQRISTGKRWLATVHFLRTRKRCSDFLFFAEIAEQMRGGVYPAATSSYILSLIIYDFTEPIDALLVFSLSSFPTYCIYFILSFPLTFSSSFSCAFGNVVVALSYRSNFPFLFLYTLCVLGAAVATQLVCDQHFSVFILQGRRAFLS